MNTSSQAPSEPSAEVNPILQQVISPALLAKLFQKLNYSIPAGALHQAAQSVQAELKPVPPVERVRLILAHAGRKDMQGALVPWHRFDRRHLPALAFHDDRWWLIERDDAHRISLTDEQGLSMEVMEGQLEQAQILWLKPTGKPASSEAPSIFATPAARLLFEELFRGKRWLFEVMLATIVVNLLAVLTSMFSMQVYDRVVPTFSYATLWALTVGIIIANTMDWCLKFVRAKLLDSVGKSVDLSTSQRLFEHLTNLRLDTRPRSVGSLAAQASGLDSVRAFFSSTIVFALADMPFALFFLVIIGALGGMVGVVYLMALPLAMLVGWMGQRALRRLSKMEVQRSTERQGLMVEAILGAEEIQSTGAAWRFAEKWQGIIHSAAEYSARSKLITSVMTTTAGTISSVAYVCAIVVGVYQIESGALTSGGLIACTILGGRVLGPISQSISMIAQWQTVRESLEMVNRLLSLEQARDKDKMLLMPDARIASVELQGVRFSYAQSPVMQLNVSQLRFNAGDRVLLLGPIGSGKSTLLKVMAGLYKPSEGRVRLGSADLWEMDPQLISAQVGYLPQDIQLFKGSLRSNLSLAGGVNDNHLLEVVQQLGIERMASDNPRGMEMDIAEGGSGLSGGQRQLVGLARVLLAQPTVWLLDEPTSSLDNEAEAKVLQTLQQHVKPQDILVVSTHRTSMLSMCNRVLVMRTGQVVADDHPDRLFANSANKLGAQGADAGRKETDVKPA